MLQWIAFVARTRPAGRGQNMKLARGGKKGRVSLMTHSEARQIEAGALSGASCVHSRFQILIATQTSRNHLNLPGISANCISNRNKTRGGLRMHTTAVWNF